MRWSGWEPSTFVHEVAVPLVHRVGARWASGDLPIAAEHMLTATLRNLLGGLLQRRGPRRVARCCWRHRRVSGTKSGCSWSRCWRSTPGSTSRTSASTSRQRKSWWRPQHTQARVVGLSVVASKNHAHAVREIEAIQMALPADTELWLGGADAGRAAADVKAFRGWVVDDLHKTETELARIGAAVNRSA